jgi:Xaa-Pro aminopeptidase
MSTSTSDRGAPVAHLRFPNFNEIDFARLRSGRLDRLQEAMREQQFPVCLLFNPANVRYATGTDVMAVFSMGMACRCCLVPAEGHPTLFEYPLAMHVSRRIVEDVRPMLSWQFRGHEAMTFARRWAREVRAELESRGLAGEPVAVDTLDTPGFLALQEEGLRLVDSGPVTLEARELKTAEEIQLFAINGAIGDVMLSRFEAAIAPGVREYELLAVLSDTLLRYHGENLFTRLVASGTNTNPWLTEAHDRIVMPGDLVGVDTDANGYEGYVIDVSRTFLCGDRPTPEQHEAYRVAHECVTGMAELVKPGMPFSEFCYAAPRLPAKYVDQRYAVMLHQAGLEDESVDIPYPEDVELGLEAIPDRVIREDMVLCLECYAGAVGAPFGVKLEDQVLVTADGCKPLCTYPFDAQLLS